MLGISIKGQERLMLAIAAAALFLVSTAAHADSITNTVGGNVILGSGNSLIETATVSDPGLELGQLGTLVVALKDDTTGTVLGVWDDVLTAGGTYTLDPSFLPTATGAYEWDATYTGCDGSILVGCTSVTLSSGPAYEYVTAPETSTVSLFGTGLLALLGLTWYGRRKQLAQGSEASLSASRNCLVYPSLPLIFCRVMTSRGAPPVRLSHASNSSTLTL